MVTTRTATLADIPALIELLNQLFAQEVEFTPNPAVQRRGLEAIVSSPEMGFIEVIENGGHIQGMVNILYSVSTALGARVAILEDMVIDEASRGQNLGTTLLNAALIKARDNGCQRVTLLSDGDNSAAHSFYEQHGFTRSSMVPFRTML